MARPASKTSIKGTRESDFIRVDTVNAEGLTGYEMNGTFKALSLAQLAAGVAVSGNGGNDIIVGGRGDDQLLGGDGDDWLEGRDGFDLLSGGAGNDRLIDNFTGASFDGGLGVDTVDFSVTPVRENGMGVAVDLGGTIFPDASITWTAAQGIDLQLGQGISGRFSNVEDAIGTAGNDMIWGNSADNRIFGRDGNDSLTGGIGGNDTLYGEGGNDELYGHAGNDTLVGGTGIDRLSGGDGTDLYVFQDLELGDIILDWNAGDRIDLSGIDAISGQAGDQAFNWIGGDAFSGTAGELRYAGGLLQGDVDGDGSADFQVQMATDPILNPPLDLIL